VITYGSTTQERVVTSLAVVKDFRVIALNVSPEAGVLDCPAQFLHAGIVTKARGKVFKEVLGLSCNLDNVIYPRPVLLPAKLLGLAFRSFDPRAIVG